MSKPSAHVLGRRTVFAGAGAVGAAGALAAAATLLPRPPAAVAAAPKPAADGGGYQVTQHVLRYYQTTRV